MTLFIHQYFWSPINSRPYPHGADTQVEGGTRQRKEGARLRVITTLEKTNG